MWGEKEGKGSGEVARDGWLVGVCCGTKGASLGRLRHCGAHVPAKSISLSHLGKHCSFWAAEGVMQELEAVQRKLMCAAGAALGV